MKKESTKIRNLLLAILFIVLGFIGLLIPIIPQVPFFLTGCYFLAKSSVKFKKWFENTKLIKYLEKKNQELKEKELEKLKRKKIEKIRKIESLAEKKLDKLQRRNLKKI